MENEKMRKKRKNKEEKLQENSRKPWKYKIFYKIWAFYIDI